MDSLIKQEAKRKLFHAFVLLYVLLYVAAGRAISLWVLGSTFFLVGVLEAVRLRNPAFNQKIIDFFGGIHRPEEVDRPSGILWTLAGCLLTIWVVPDQDVVVTVLLYVALGDGISGLVGRRWGHVRIGSKSLEGSLSFFFVCWVVGTICLQSGVRMPEVLLGALVATLLEVLPLPLNDNFWIPVASGLFLTFMRIIG